MAGTDAAFKALDRYFEFYSFLKLAPYNWDRKSRTFTVLTDKLQILHLYFGMSFGAFGTFYGVCRIMKEIFAPTPNFNAPQIILFIFYIIILFVSVVINAVFFFNGDSIVAILTRGFQFDHNRHMELCPPKKGTRPVVLMYEKILIQTVPASVIAAVCSGALSFAISADPLQRTIIDLVPELYQEYRFYIRSFAAMGVPVCAIYVWSPILLMAISGIIIMHGLEHWFSVINGENMGADAVRARNALKGRDEFTMTMYQSMAILAEDGNRCMIFYAMPAIIGVSAIVAILCNFATVDLYDMIPMPGYLTFPVVSIIIYFGFGMGLPQGAKFHEASIKYIEKYKGSHNPYLRRRANALRPVVFKIGPFFALEKGITFAYFGFITDFSIDLIISINI